MKVINHPYECGYCNIKVNHRDDKCRHPKNIHGLCDDPMNFPENCPLGTCVYEKGTIRELHLIIKNHAKHA